VFANLVIDGKRYGVKPFVVPLRDPQTYCLLPGVTIGDIGMKMVQYFSRHIGTLGPECD